ncbi:hypothetical protein QYE76_024700 [Lolium multiflorum]|uniref:Uncharacterized protein n=1 Tax=Lolium multiflorum TaxID=4521 RepID=A0AAD8RH63_LOLMU|nr:hypothetical protein QYE76_024700 [Lolium multiflorum]
MLRPGRVYPPTDRHESARYWSAGFFYLKDVSDPASEKKLPAFKNCPAIELPSWTHCPHFSDSHFSCTRTFDVSRYTGSDDPVRATKDNLSADAIDKRIRILIKIPRELHVHVCNKDIHMNGSGTAPPKAQVLKREQVSSFPITPEVEVPPKASSASKPDPKDIIDLDDLPEDPAHHGDSAQGTSTPIPPPDQPSSAFAGPTDEEQEQKVKLLQVTNATRVSLEPTPSLQKLTLAQRHAEVSAMLNKITEIEGLRQNAENSQKAIQLLETRLKALSLERLSAKVKVLEAENESLQNFMKESSSKETEARKELSEKHAPSMLSQKACTRPIPDEKVWTFQQFLPETHA